MTESNFTIGCDPEFFLKDKTSGKLISAIPHIVGTKYEPLNLPKGGNIQRDNVAVEIATDPATGSTDFVNRIRDTLSEAIKVLPKDTEIVPLPSAHFDKDQLEHPEAQIFGCDPDYDAWEVTVNDAPCAIDNTFRSCGAHIHVGTDGKDNNAFLLDPMEKIKTVRVMDCMHGIISTVLDYSKEAIDRRKLYGKPGAHRYKDYGIEYRVLSNYWLKSPTTVMLMYHLTEDALSVVRDGKADSLISDMGEQEIKNTINTGDYKTAMKMIELHVLQVMSEDSIHYFYEAAAKLKSEDLDFYSEWNLNSQEVGR